MTAPLFNNAIVARFWAKIDVRGPAECWLWTASTGGPGYGHAWVMLDGRKVCVDAHRFAWMATHGPIPRGLVVQHLCNEKLCCNPSHLRLGTPAENIAQALRDGLISRKLAARDVFDVIQERKAGCLLVEIAGRRGLSVNHVRRILSGGIWSAVTGIQQQQVTSTKCEQTNFFNLLKGDFSHARN